MAAVGKNFSVKRQRPQNPLDTYAVVVKKDGVTVG